MANIVGFQKRVPPSAASRGSLAELVAKQKLLAEQQAGYGQIQPIQSWTQGAAQMTGALMTGLQQRAAASDEAAGRQKLAEIQAGINLDTGATPEQIAQAGLLDQDYARSLQEGAAKARADARQAQAVVDAREDEQRFRAGETEAERLARHAENEAQNAITTRGQDIDVAQGNVTAAETHRGNVATEQHNEATLAQTTARDKSDAEDADLTRGVTVRGQDITAATAAEQAKIEREKMVAPATDTGKAVREYNAGAYGQVGSPEAIARRDAEIKCATTHPAPASTIINTGESADLRKEYYKKMGGTVFPQYQTEAVTAGNLSRGMEVLDQIDPSIQGPIVGRVAQMFPGFSSNASVFESIVKRLAPQQRAEGSGSTSDIEYQGMLESLPQLINNPEANAMIREVVKAQAAISIQRGGIVNQWRSGKLSEDAAFDKLSQLDSQSIMNPKLQTMIEQIKGSKPVMTGDQTKAPAIVRPGDDLLNQYAPQ
jgi:hypothetical protein